MVQVKCECIVGLWSIGIIDFGASFPTAYDGDSETIARRPGGDLIISFERNHRLLTYSGELTVNLIRPLGIQYRAQKWRFG